MIVLNVRLILGVFIFLVEQQLSKNILSRFFGVSMKVVSHKSLHSLKKEFGVFVSTFVKRLAM
jgi:hypothetical protein